MTTMSSEKQEALYWVQKTTTFTSLSHFLLVQILLHLFPLLETSIIVERPVVFSALLLHHENVIMTEPS